MTIKSQLLAKEQLHLVMAVNLHCKIRSMSPHLTTIVRWEFSKTTLRKRKDIVLVTIPRKV
jgi:hypothetical protein